MNHIPNPSEMLELSLWSFAEHARELIGKHNQLSQKQREELAEIGRELVKMEAA